MTSHEEELDPKSTKEFRMLYTKIEEEWLDGAWHPISRYRGKSKATLERSFGVLGYYCTVVSIDYPRGFYVRVWPKVTEV